MEDLRYDLLFYASREGIVRVDFNFKIIDVNDSFEKLFKYQRDEIVGLHLDTIFAVDKDIEKIKLNTLRVLDGHMFYDEGQRIDKSGVYHDVLITGFPVMKDGVVDGVFISYKDVTTEKKALIELENQKNILNALFKNSPDAIVRFDKDNTIVDLNQKFIEIFGYTLEEIYGLSLEKYIGNIVPPDEIQALSGQLENGKDVAIESVRYGKNGKAVHLAIRGVPIFKDQVYLGGFGIYTDITERKKSEEAITYMSYHDALTQLYNRRFFEEEVKRLDTSRNLPLGLIMCDANGLKLTNDVFGHQAGDTLLIKIAQILKSQCRQDEIIARLGGDEFVILLPSTGLLEVQKVCNRIIKACSEHMHYHLPVSVSFGYAVKSDSDESPDELFKRAEDMMYEQKVMESARYKRKMIATIMAKLHEDYPGQAKHSREVSHLCKEIAEVLGLSSKEIHMAREVGWYHDIGKIGIQNSDDPHAMRKHPEIGSRIVSAVGDLIDYAQIIQHHHEHYDGTGYPNGLKENAIPLLSRIVAVADAYDNLTNPNVGLSMEDALSRIKGSSCILFDPIVVSGLVEILNHKKV